MGGMDCHQHPGYIQDDERWSCCGQKIYRVQYTDNYAHLRLLSSSVGKASYTIPPKVRGCQPCDHNTAEKPFSHKDAQPIAELSALLPFMNKKFPFELRKGFDNGVLRRCAIRKLHFPPAPLQTQHQREYLKTQLEYIDNKGVLQTYEYDAFDVLPRMYGMEVSAVDIYGTEEEYIEIPVTHWWPEKIV